MGQHDRKVGPLTVQMTTPDGVKVTVSEEKAERLKPQGYRVVSDAEPVDLTPAKPRRGRPRKTTDAEAAK